MKTWSLKLRLIIIISFSIISALSIISIVAYIELKESLLKNIDPTLKVMAKAILSELSEDESDKDYQSAFNSITTYNGQQDANQYRVWMDGSDTNLLVRDDIIDNLLSCLPPDIKPEVGGFAFYDLVQEKFQYRVVWTRQNLKQGIVNIIIATSSNDVYHEMEEFIRLLLICGASFWVASFLLVPPTIKAAMRPIEQISSIIQQVKLRNIEQKALRNLKVPEELIPFLDALDSMFIRLDKGVTQQKQFISDASHELRTPLAIIKSTIQTAQIKKGNLTDYEHLFDDILQDVNRMEHLVEHLLSLARFDESEPLTDWSTINLDCLLNELTDVFNATIDQQGGTIICENCLPTIVNGNRDELWQLFANILDNAVKYGPQNGIVRITLVHDPDGYATVCIHDDGGNISPEAIKHLFTRFYRIESSRSRATGGAGLGLAIAKEICLRHHGRIEITSDVRKGTSVIVQLPRIISDMV